MKKENKRTIAMSEVQESMPQDSSQPIIDFTNIEDVLKAVIMNEILSKKY